MRIGVISDTHIPSRAAGIPAKVFEVWDGVETVLHAGDLTIPGVLEELGCVAPVCGVLGNCDDRQLGRILPARVVVELGGVRIGMVHDSGPSRGRRPRLRRAFPDCRVVVFGHSHQPLIEDDGDLLLLNPGSACDPRQAKAPTVALLEVAEGVPEVRLIELS